ncbi:hypothetical protein COCVIDRAFT_16034 [Bipolaris victoriae FI3]|uniref:Uncharacterized protein n=1 Tax=Bipolaris victoriae (strain FI3) TaxID=930091 RepID=W7EJV1_BIPV3|nr:hypothetical protein COCVIDRAFT_16034 [Bipolaris victoriae FI3]
MSDSALSPGQTNGIQPKLVFNQGSSFQLGAPDQMRPTTNTEAEIGMKETLHDGSTDMHPLSSYSMDNSVVSSSDNADIELSSLDLGFNSSSSLDLIGSRVIASSLVLKVVISMATFSDICFTRAKEVQPHIQTL